MSNLPIVLRALPLLLALCFAGLSAASARADEGAVRTLLMQAILSEGDEQADAIAKLAETGSPLVQEVLGAWRQGDLFIHDSGDGTKIPFTRVGGKSLRVDNGEAIEAPDAPAVDTTSKLRRAIKSTLDVLALAAPDPGVRRSAALKLGMEQKVEYLPLLEGRLAKENAPAVRRALEEALAFIRVADPDPATRIAAIKEFSRLKTIGAMDVLKKLSGDADPDVAAAAEVARRVVENHIFMVDLKGTLFRGLSNGSVLLVVALGLAITFGLMGVINMAHGEIMVVGAYTTYVMQGLFGAGVFIPFMGLAGNGLNLPGMNLGGFAYESFFLVSLPAAFLVAASVGILIERSVIRFLYRRPLESLLATWGISLILQQLFRLVFGSNNVQVYSPAYLSGNFTVADVAFGWNRLFIIGSAIVIVLGTWLLLTKTPLGLLIRAVMQNREMASCMGVRTERVNMLTFGLGSGLAGVAGALLSQIANVGPSLGQTMIVDCFMTVVVGGVGNIVGTVCSAAAIGVTDQTLQQVLGNPVLGKILVLGAIILFLQWKPGGLFPTRSRALDG